MIPDIYPESRNNIADVIMIIMHQYQK